MKKSHMIGAWLLGALAFTFSGAASRFDARRALAVEEANAVSTAYARVDMLPASFQPGMRELFRLGNYLLWVTPNGTALVIDTTQGREDLTDAEIDALFRKK